MHLYHLTLNPPTTLVAAVVGNFSGSRQQELIVAHANRLELLRVDANTGKISVVLDTYAFGSIRSLASFRLTGGTKGVFIFALEWIRVS
jgi:splicing factor 3B subunit 3